MEVATATHRPKLAARSSQRLSCRRRRHVVAWTSVCKLAELDQGPNASRIGTHALTLVKTGDEIHATAALCPHKFAPLAEGTVEDGCLKCPVHEAAFHLETGEPRDGDGWAGRLDVYPCRVTDGVVEVDC